MYCLFSFSTSYFGNNIRNIDNSSLATDIHTDWMPKKNRQNYFEYAYFLDRNTLATLTFRLNYLKTLRSDLEANYYHYQISITFLY